MNEEEKNAIEKIKEIIECFYCFPNPTCIELKDCDCSTLEIALELIEKLQKKNEKLKNKLLDTLEGQKVIKEETPQYIKENYIPVEKVKDNIEELKAQYKTALEENSTEAFILKCQITILQELIEEGEKK